jgi:hypothetical protein
MLSKVPEAQGFMQDAASFALRTHTILPPLNAYHGELLALALLNEALVDYAISRAHVEGACGA